MSARLQRLLATLACSPGDALALALLAAGGLAALGLLTILARAGMHHDATSPRLAAGESAPSLSVTAEDIVVHVAGEVARAGVYRLPGGARVADALAAAGGPLPSAALHALNLARPLEDGEQVHVPAATPDPVEGQAPSGGPAGTAASAGPVSARLPDGRLNLNRATAAELDTLPGIGPVLAERIVRHRETSGAFSSVGDLRAVPGIGEKTFQSIAPLVAV